VTFAKQEIDLGKGEVVRSLQEEETPEIEPSSESAVQSKEEPKISED